MILPLVGASRRGGRLPLLYCPVPPLSDLNCLSNELDLCKLLGSKGPIIGFCEKLFLLGWTTKLSSPVNFFAIAFMRSRQNLSTSARGMDFNFVNKYLRSSILALVATKARAFNIPTLYASCFLVAHSHILSNSRR